MKKVLSLVLVIAMVLSSMSFAFASPLTDIAGNDHEDAINTLVGLDIIDGYEDGTFRPEVTVTRAQMAKMLVITLGYGDLVAGSKSNFVDTQGHWADAYVALAAGRGLVVGYPNGTFKPDKTVSYDEAITMVVRALGYTDASNELKNMTWPTNFKVKAAELKLTKDVVLSVAGADRGGVAQLINNALMVNMVTVDTDGNVMYVKNGNVNKLLLNSLATEDTINKVEPKHLDKDDNDYKGEIVDLAPYMYQKIKVFINDDEDVVYVSEVVSDVLVGEFRTATSDAGKVNVRIDGKNKLYSLKNASTPVYYNGVEVDMTESDMEVGATIVNLNKAAATFVLDSDKKITGIVANKYTGTARVSNVYNGKTKIENIALPLNSDSKVDYTKLTITGAVDSLEDIKVDDIIVLFAGKGQTSTTKDTENLTIEVVRDTVEGKITKTNSDGEFYIDGKYYAASEFNKYAFLVGEEGTYFLDQKGQLVDFEEAESNEPKDYAVITEVLNGVYSTRILADAEITVVNAKGEEVTYKFDDKAKVGVNYVFTRTDQTVVSSAADLVVNATLSKYDVIKYTLNSKGKIDKITMVKDNVDTSIIAKIDITGKSYVFASNAVVFNLDGSDVEVVDKDKLGDKVVILTSKNNKNGEIEMFFVKGLGASDTYAFIVSQGTMLNDNDDTVQSLTAYVDGVEVFYEAKNSGLVTDNLIDKAKMVKLDLDGSIISGATTESALVSGTGKVTKVSGGRFELNSEWFTLAQDVVVYILDDGEFDSVGTASSVYFDAQVAAYAFDGDNITDKVVEVLFIFE